MTATIGNVLVVKIDPMSITPMGCGNVSVRVLDQIDERGNAFIDCVAVVPESCLSDGLVCGSETVN